MHFQYLHESSTLAKKRSYAVASGAVIYVGQRGYTKKEAQRVATKFRAKGKKAKVMRRVKALFAH